MIVGIIQTYVYYKVVNEASKILFDYALYAYAPNIIINGITMVTDPLWNCELKKNILNNNIDQTISTDDDVVIIIEDHDI